MSKLLLTPARIRTIISGSTTEKDLEKALRKHKIRYSYTTAPGYLAIRIPCRTGAVLITRTATRNSYPFRTTAAPATGYPYPVPRFTWDD